MSETVALLPATGARSGGFQPTLLEQEPDKLRRFALLARISAFLKILDQLGQQFKQGTLLGADLRFYEITMTNFSLAKTRRPQR
jgi:hypothetical protein